MRVEERQKEITGRKNEGKKRQQNMSKTKNELNRERERTR